MLRAAYDLGTAGPQDFAEGQDRPTWFVNYKKTSNGRPLEIKEDGDDAYFIQYVVNATRTKGESPSS